MAYEPVRKQDSNELSSLINEIISATENLPSFNWTIESFNEELANSTCWVTKDAFGRIMSMLCFRTSPDSFEITVLGTHPSYRRMGQQQALLRGLQEKSANEARSIFLEVHESNHEAKALYEKLGFRILRVRPRYYSDGGSALCLEWVAN